VINPSVSLCLSVCPRVYLWNRWTDLHEILCADFLWPVARSLSVWRRCDTLCTSGFMDGVIFGRNWPYGDSGVAMPGRSLTSMNVLLLRVDGKKFSELFDVVAERVECGRVVKHVGGCVQRTHSLCLQRRQTVT